MPADPQPHNSLGAEPSLYLRQHADNPVHWHPWSEAALAEARRTGRPILLSIGYAACHWCHVMAHESFEDPATAKLMNAHFVNIKVDREERPDLDRTYQLAHQLITGRPGGWPLTLFLDPDDLAPFFAGTYFPADARYGMPAFTTVLERVAEWYAAAGAERADIAARVRSALEEIARAEPAALDACAWRDAAVAELAAQFDREHAGFGRAQKFPRAPALELLRTSSRDTRMAEISERTLHAMARGGVHDHVGGGFFRYTVDREWEIPHFEKMLYDNALLLGLYAQAWRERPTPEHADAARGIVRWVRAEMRAPGGAFYSSLDADSAGGEGAYYTWTPTEIEALLAPPARSLVSARFGLDRPANFDGRWHLRVVDSDGVRADVCGADAQILAEAMALLRRARAARARPPRDEKVLAAWNAMLVDALARAGEIFTEPEWVVLARTAFDFLRAKLWRDSTLFAVWAGGKAYNPAYLDDYAWMLRASLSLLERRWCGDDLAFACALADALLDRFADADDGGLWFTAREQPVRLARPRGGMDDATPAGAAVAASALYRLGELCGDLRYMEQARRALEALGGQIAAQPSAHAAMIGAALEVDGGLTQVILRGEPEHLAEWRTAIAATQARPAVYAIPASATDLPAYIAAMPCAGPVAAYVCRAGRCSPPVAELEAVLRQLA